MSKVFHEGQCDCGKTRYRLLDSPLIVHGCHCRACQRQTGATNAVNVLIEKDKVQRLSGDVLEHEFSTPSGNGQLVTRCRFCLTTIWSEYLIFAKRRGAPVRFIRAGTLDEPDRFPPDVHIFTATRQTHLELPSKVPNYPEFYDIPTVWTGSSLDRLKRLQRKPLQSERSSKWTSM